MVFAGALCVQLMHEALCRLRIDGFFSRGTRVRVSCQSGMLFSGEKKPHHAILDEILEERVVSVQTMESRGVKRKMSKYARQDSAPSKYVSMQNHIS